MLLNRYLFKQTFFPTLSLIAVLTGIIWLSQSMRFVDWIINQGLSIWAFFTVSLLLLPNFILFMLAPSVFVGTLWGCHRLLNEYELIAARAAGISPLKLTKPFLAVAGCTCIIGYMLSLWLLPLSYTVYKNLQTELRNEYAAVLLKEGVFSPLGKGRTVYVNNRTSDNTLQGVIFHDTSNPKRSVTITAREGALLRENNPKLVLRDGVQQRWSPDDEKLAAVYFDEYYLDLAVFQDMGTRKKTANEQGLNALLNASPEEYGEKRARKYRAAGHGRILMPLYSLVFVLIATAILLRSSFARQGYSKQMIISVCCMLVIQGSAIALENLAASNERMVILMYLNAAVPALIALWYLGRRRV